MYNWIEMKIILTHEQADFDALASLLGAHLLDEQSVPVLPRRMNRNVRTFLTLYGLEFPFVEPTDLPKGKIDTVTLVDTQSLITLKGMDNETKIYVIDHHERRSDLPEDWHVKTEDIGATTTILVEAIQEHGLHLSLTQASLMLLGIYEDTGKLTYSRTTPRDVRAAAILLEQGASLQIMQEYINHPLSHTQQKIYDQLREGLETYTIHGNTILVGTADARHTDEELSTIAHKLRDLLDPDAIFLLVDTSSGTQLIARATTDQVNVGAIASYFGGGGHPRAAAALVREKRAGEVFSELVDILPEYVHPAVTVAEIMSRRPHILAPDMKVKEAAQRMQRYGYEGYPVTEDGKLIGLLTRRAVDRTLGHKLNLTVRQVMNAGSVTISPDAPLETLQERMTDTGWGQIPVVVDDKIIGIVTRTDLIKTLTPKESPSGRRNLAGKLTAGLPPSRLALLQAVAETAKAQKSALYIVGGFVRDLLLERPSLDFDLVVEGDAISLGRALAETYGGRTTTHRRFGTAKWQIEKIRDSLAKELGKNSGGELKPEGFPETLDLVSARREFYTYPTALPTVERGSIKLDLHRRDFTINTLALRLDGSHYGDLHDYWGGLADLQAGQVRVLHSLSFVDDPTRILRAVRFEQRFGFQIEPRTLELLQNALGLLDRVSGDRLRHELNFILQESAWESMLERLAELNVLTAIHPNLPWDENTQVRIHTAMEASVPEGWEIHLRQDGYPLSLALTYLNWLIALPGEDAQVVTNRLRIPGWLADAIQAGIQLYRQQDTLAGYNPSQAVAAYDQRPHLALLACYLVCDDTSARQKIAAYFEEWQFIRPQTSGYDLRERGIPPGPKYSRILDQLRAAWLDGTISTEEKEQEMLENLLDREATDG
jgi:tRNA nucleotidyltransferase (CCA-adding enzyme)